MAYREDWQLFFSTGLPQAYTYLKARSRQRTSAGQKKKSGSFSGGGG